MWVQERMMLDTKTLSIQVMIALCLTCTALGDEALPVVPVEGQPLAANIRRLMQALDQLGHALPAGVASQLQAAAGDRDQVRLQNLLDPQVLLVVAINP